MQMVVTVIHIVVSLFLIILIVLQTQGKGLSSTWGGSGASYHSKRGMEKLLFGLTVFLAGLFLITSLFSFLTF